MKERGEKDSTIVVLEEKCSLLEEMRSKEQKQAGSLDGQLEKLRKNLEEATEKGVAAQQELMRLKKELETNSRLVKQSEQETHTKDLR